jgi:3-oxoacyl-[acyl-carrier-protein] synthase II
MREAEAWRAQVAGSTTAVPPHSVIAGQPLWSTTEQLATRLGLGGLRLTVNTACSSSANAILLGTWQVGAGRASRALVGGVEVLTRMTQAGFGSLGLLDPEGCRPFDQQRRGLTLGEGAAFLALEPLASARARGAHVHALVLGGAIGAEAHHPTSPDPEGRGAARVIAGALADAGLDVAAIDYVNAHGTGTPQNDLAETRALHAAFGERAATMPTSSSKSMIGHTLAAAGAIESLITLLGLEHGFLPPTAGLARPDPGCALDHVIGTARPARPRVALKTAFGFGGNLTALVLGHTEVVP